MIRRTQQAVAHTVLYCLFAIAKREPARPSGGEVFRYTAYHTSFCHWLPFSFAKGVTS